MRFGVVFGLTFALSGCGTLEHKTVLVNAGDSKQAVLKIMGAPAERQFQGQLEAWQYCKTGAGFGYHDYRIIWFVDGAVTGVTPYKNNTPGSCIGGLMPIRWESAPDQTIEVRNR
jgi:hypothetical protein